jgi:regulatory protein
LRRAIEPGVFKREGYSPPRSGQEALISSEFSVAGYTATQAVALQAAAFVVCRAWCLMAGKITELRFQKRNKDRVNVYVDGRFAFGLAAIEAARLKVGQELSDADIARLQKQDEIERAYERALNFLSYRPRSEAEVRRNLRGKDAEEQVIERVIERLTRAGLLDDREFARYWVENRAQFKPRGARALRQELWEKGVPDAVVAETLEGFDEEEAARQVAETGARKMAHLAPRDFRRKLSAYMMRRGFSYAVINPLIEEMLETARCESLPDTGESGESLDE